MPTNRIREIRNKRGLTLRDLSKRTNLSVSHLSNLEWGRRTLHTDDLQIISAALDSPPAEVCSDAVQRVQETFQQLSA